MTTDQVPEGQKTHKSKTVYRSSASDAVYAFGMIGAWVFYLSHATTFWVGVLGILKGIVWPAMLVFEALKVLQM
jgi:hypothetical protein